jgi:hypothetical protein
MKNFLIALFALIAAWDAFTTYIGVYSITEQNDEGLIYSVVVSILVFAFMIGTHYILNIEGLAGKILKVFWGIAIIIDGVTSFLGNSGFLDPDNLILWAIVVFVTLLTTASGVIVSYIHAN